MKVLCLDHVGTKGALQASGIYEVESQLGGGMETWFKLKGVGGNWASPRFKVLEELPLDQSSYEKPLPPKDR